MCKLGRVLRVSVMVERTMKLTDNRAITFIRGMGVMGVLWGLELLLRGLN